MTSPRLPKLPQLLDRKIYKTGQTRGADDDVIYQNRVSRTSTVLIPYSVWETAHAPPKGEQFEYGSITLIRPEQYFGAQHVESELRRKGLQLGQNALIFYETRDQWRANDPDELGWEVATSRQTPLGGQYVARIPAITAEDGERIVRGFNTTSNKGAGIRAYEYASATTIRNCRWQLEALYWLCDDAVEIAASNGMRRDAVLERREAILKICEKGGLLDFGKLINARILSPKHKTICPLCLKKLEAGGFFSKLEQAEGREVSDLTVTQLNLFHIKELRYGKYRHRPYNLGWGHHHCNVVVKDDSIEETLNWMNDVLNRNVELGYFASKTRGS